ncbi:HNH endonuclease [Mycobacterium riyadhense]|uniref:HNH endonuclease n=1 Tax=Mycobacterium riyadhense TaxID=486698 RepID=UPI00195E57CB|nr:HNH endonuclease signature motif containing protein [Mycobacterium riyadhense]
MTWEPGRQGGSHIPPRVRTAVRRRDNDECQLGYDGCIGIYQQIDHKISVADLGVARAHSYDDLDNLQCVCIPCHKKKVAAESAAGRRRRNTAARRRPERHPGLLW